MFITLICSKLSYRISLTMTDEWGMDRRRITDRSRRNQGVGVGGVGVWKTDRGRVGGVGRWRRDRGWVGAMDGGRIGGGWGR